MLTDRMFRAAMLDSLVFDEIKEDRESMNQAVQVIVIVGVIGILGSVVQTLNAAPEAAVGPNADVPTSIWFTAASTIVGWVVAASLVYLIGTGVFGGAGSFQESLRALAFAQSPSVIAILGVPLAFLGQTAGAILGGILGFAAAIWVLVASAVAARQTLGISTGKATITMVIVAVVLVVLSASVTFVLFPEVFQAPTE